MDGRLAVRLVIAARLISSTGAEAAFFVGMWGKAAYEFDSGPTGLAVMSGAIGLGAMIGAVIGGSLVDRLDARRTILLSEVLFIPATLSLMLADDMTALISIGTVSFVTMAMLETAITSMPPLLVDADELEPANARLESANWLALVAGPAIGAVLVSTLDFDAIFLFDAITSVVALLLIVPIRMPAVPRGEDDADADAGLGAVAQAVAGMRYAFSSPPIRTVLILAGMPAVAFGMFVALEPLFYRDIVGAPVETLGWVNAIFGVGLFAGSTLLARTKGRWSGFRSAIVVSVLAGLGSTVYVISGDLRIVVLGAVCWSVPLGVSLPMTRTLAQRATTPQYVGRVMGAYSTVTSGAGLLPVVLAPWLAVALGVQPVLIGSGLVVVVGAPLLWRAAVRLDEEGALRPVDELALDPAEPAPAGVPSGPLLHGPLEPGEPAP